MKNIQWVFCFAAGIKLLCYILKVTQERISKSLRASLFFFKSSVCSEAKSSLFYSSHNQVSSVCNQIYIKSHIFLLQSESSQKSLCPSPNQVFCYKSKSSLKSKWLETCAKSLTKCWLCFLFYSEVNKTETFSFRTTIMLFSLISPNGLEIYNTLRLS